MAAAIPSAAAAALAGWRNKADKGGSRNPGGRKKSQNRAFRVENFTSRSTVVWNPWTPQKLPDDFDPAKQAQMLCVKSVKVKPDKILLAPG